MGLFRIADRKKLLPTGDPLPTSAKMITLYRGVSGYAAARNEPGISWTDDLNIACNFARRWSEDRFNDSYGYDPAVFRATVRQGHIICFTNAKGEREFILHPDSLPKSERMEFRAGELELRSRVWNYDNFFRMYQRPQVADPEQWIEICLGGANG